MSWYVLQVMTGMEQEIRERLDGAAVRAIAPVEHRMIHSHGQWIPRQYTLFTGYVFLFIENRQRLLPLPGSQRGAIRLLTDGDGEPAALSEAEARWVLWLNEHLCQPSEVELLEDGCYRVLCGALLPLEKQIVRLDRHRRRALVRMRLAGRVVTIWLSVKITNAEQSNRLIRPCSIIPPSNG